MKYLNLIASDFDSLTEDCVDQYTEKDDCPIYRAAKRTRIDVDCVYPRMIVLKNGNSIKSDEFYHPNVEKARKKLLAGAKFARINITN